MEIREESRLKFGFPDTSHVVKFDDTRFYRKIFNTLPGAKAVDFIAVEEDNISFIEVKNCVGDEGNCRWRIFPDNRKKETSNTQVDVNGRESLDIEVAQKVAMTLAALLGAKSYENIKETVNELAEIQDTVFSKNFSGDEKRRYVILFLEGNFGGHTRSKKMIMDALQRSLKSKIKWLNCKVSVVDSDTYNERIFQIVP